MENFGAVVVSWDFEEKPVGKNSGVVIVGKQTKKGMEVINAFQGDEAREIVEKLLRKEEKK